MFRAIGLTGVYGFRQGSGLGFRLAGPLETEP